MLPLGLPDAYTSVTHGEGSLPGYGGGTAPDSHRLPPLPSPTQHGTTRHHADPFALPTPVSGHPSTRCRRLAGDCFKIG
ncbi:hypothetical protein FrCorBMG51_22780, partial [Protofrankia coriariae]